VKGSSESSFAVYMLGSAVEYKVFSQPPGRKGTSMSKESSRDLAQPEKRGKRVCM